MNTLFDFVTHVKGVEYLIAILFIAGFLILWEVLKPKPFKKLIHTGMEDITYIRKGGMGNLLRSVGKLVAAPFIGLAYVLFLPIGFAAAFCYAVLKGVFMLIGKSASFGWRPAEAYLGGKKKSRSADSQSAEGEDK